jgi:glycosyltransferase 2 family protein
VLVALQLGFLALVLAALGYALQDVWGDALPRLRNADLVDLGVALGVLAAYYLLFVLGWQWILAGLGLRIGYALALQAEMASMLAKYVPGMVWTPLARVLWVRRAGVGRSGLVLGSIALEAGLSALAGVLVFAVALAWVGTGRAPLLPLALFSAVVAVLVHPRVYRALARRLLRRFGEDDPPVLRYRTMVALLAYYSATWLVGGLALFFLVRSVGGEPALSDVPYFGGTAAVGAIVAVVTVFAPSGLGVREGSMYGLLLAVTAEGIALGATVLNRLAITLVEALLLAVGVAVWRTGARAAPPEDEPGRWQEPDLARDRS